MCTMFPPPDWKTRTAFVWYCFNYCPVSNLFHGVSRIIYTEEMRIRTLCRMSKIYRKLSSPGSEMMWTLLGVFKFNCYNRAKSLCWASRRSAVALHDVRRRGSNETITSPSHDNNCNKNPLTAIVVLSYSVT